jgi:hypothetical protein
MRRVQSWSTKNVWGEIERSYRLPTRATATLMVDLTGHVEEVKGPWISILRAELYMGGARIWLTAQRGDELLRATSEDPHHGDFRELDEQLALMFGPLEEVQADAPVMAMAS